RPSAPSRRVISGGPSGRGPGPSGPHVCPSKEPYVGRIPGGRRAAHPSPMTAGTLPLSGRVRVLVVDDNDGFRGSLAALLGGEDLEVVGEASSGIEAIRLVNELAPDVVLMDVRMPQMDGIETTRRLKAQHPSLEIAQEALLERGARRQQLIGRVGHELRTPVTVILGLAQTLRRGGLDDQQLDEVLDTLVLRTEGLARLVRRFEAAIEAGLTEWANVTGLAKEVGARDPRI